MASRLPCKHEIAKRKAKTPEEMLRDAMRSAREPLVMGATPHCLECVREAGKKFAEKIREQIGAKKS